jgi:hypothetical protein
MGTFSISMVDGEWDPSKYYDKNQGEICFPNLYFMYYMHNLFSF